MTSYDRCRSCLQPIIWAVTEAGKRQPLDRDPDPDGIVIAYQDPLGGWHSRALPNDQPVLPPWKRYTTHFATCPHADEHRKPTQEKLRGQGVAVLADYRKKRRR